MEVNLIKITTLYADQPFRYKVQFKTKYKGTMTTPCARISIELDGSAHKSKVILDFGATDDELGVIVKVMKFWFGSISIEKDEIILGKLECFV